jgi:phosphinothricin acetyltransferase
MGYRLVGTFNQCGYKFGRWYDMIWMEKMIGAHEAQPEKVIPFSLLNITDYRR